MRFSFEEKGLFCYLHSWDLSDAVFPKYLEDQLEVLCDDPWNEDLVLIVTVVKLPLDLGKRLEDALNRWCFNGIPDEEKPSWEVPCSPTPLQKELNERIHGVDASGWKLEDAEGIVIWVNEHVAQLKEEHPHLKV